MKTPEAEQPPQSDAPDSGEDARRVDLGKLLRALLDRNPIGQETVERLLDVVIRLLSRREVLERVLKSEFVRHIRDMQSEITEIFGLASQADVQEIKTLLGALNERLDTLQKTLDEIVVEVEAA
jgi:hypothetical protein